MLDRLEQFGGLQAPFCIFNFNFFHMFHKKGHIYIFYYYQTFIIVCSIILLANYLV